MNKEEILGAFSLVNNPIVLSEEEVKDVQKAIKELQQENQKDKEVIDKAIEYIKQHWVIDNPVLFKNDLLEILQDKEVSE